MAGSVRARALTEGGISLFRRYLESLRRGSREGPPWTLLEDRHASRAVGFEAPLPVDLPGRRLGAARALREAFDGSAPSEFAEHQGVWSWVSLLYFDRVCPEDRNGRRSPGRDYRHIPEREARLRHRHLLAGPWEVYRHLGEDAKLLLSGVVHRENTFFHELACRQGFISNPGIIEAADRLYLNAETGNPKQGATARGAVPGTLRRFVAVVRQLELNYDLFRIPADELLDLLPPEFDRWKRAM
jgi:hypothetical protein